LWLTQPEEVRVKHIFSRRDLLKRSYLYLGTNSRGGMMRASVSWGELHSKYDALLAANPDPQIPEDRQVLFTRCRGWLVYQGYSQKIDINCMTAFRYKYNRAGLWQFQVPTGQGESVGFTINALMIPDRNAVRLSFTRMLAGLVRHRLSDHDPVQLILRPDIEIRSFHETTKAYLGPEKRWPPAIQLHPAGFEFAPEGEVVLKLTLPNAKFESELEWYYMVHRSLDAERGLDPSSDLFSPGYFSIDLIGGQTATLSAGIPGEIEYTGTDVETGGALKTNEQPIQLADFHEKTISMRPREALVSTLDQFIVRRGKLKTVIAGYPWFLDWGRDSLIFVRGMIAGGHKEEARSVLKLFGQFEKDGTIPNMIHGNNAGNRDTSDAPLWFFVACEDLVTDDNSEEFLE
jgi:hypothetical protein